MFFQQSVFSGSAPSKTSPSFPNACCLLTEVFPLCETLEHASTITRCVCEALRCCVHPQHATYNKDIRTPSAHQQICLQIYILGNISSHGAELPIQLQNSPFLLLLRLMLLLVTKIGLGDISETKRANGDPLVAKRLSHY